MQLADSFKGFFLFETFKYEFKANFFNMKFVEISIIGFLVLGLSSTWENFELFMVAFLKLQAHQEMKNLKSCWIQQRVFS